MKTYKKLTEVKVAQTNQNKMLQNYTKTIKNVTKSTKKKS
jgi:hypothetical protein